VQCSEFAVKLQISSSLIVKNSTSRDQFSLLYVKTGRNYSAYQNMSIDIDSNDNVEYNK